MFAVSDEGHVYGWGRNEKGQLGIGDAKDRKCPTLVKELTGYKIVSVATGRNHSLFLTGKSHNSPTLCNQIYCSSHLTTQIKQLQLKLSKQSPVLTNNEEILKLELQIEKLKVVCRYSAPLSSGRAPY